MGKKNLIYDSETGDVMDSSEQQGPIPVEPLRIPDIVENFMAQYIPAESEARADIVFDLASLRDELCCWMPFGCKEDPLQDYLTILANEGFIMHTTASGPAVCVITKDGGRVIGIYDEAELLSD